MRACVCVCVRCNKMLINSREKSHIKERLLLRRKKKRTKIGIIKWHIDDILLPFFFSPLLSIHSAQMRLDKTVGTATLNGRTDEEQQHCGENIKTQDTSRIFLYNQTWWNYRTWWNVSTKRNALTRQCNIKNKIDRYIFSQFLKKEYC